MIKSATFTGEIKDGKLFFDNRDKLDLYLSALKGRVRVKISRIKKVRTTGAPGEKSNMNGYYWLHIHIIEKETGEDAKVLHRFFKRKFLPPVYETVLGKTLKLPATTTELSGIEMMEYMEKINALTGVPIPPPDDQYN